MSSMGEEGSRDNLTLRDAWEGEDCPLSALKVHKERVYLLMKEILFSLYEQR